MMLSPLFFIIIYDTMQKVGYIRFGAQPDLTTVITFFFFFGPPRLIEGLFVTDFTSRVYMKEEEIKQDIDVLLKNDGLDSNSYLMKQVEEIKICVRWKTGGLICKKMRYVCTFCFGCFQCPVDDEGFCECCDLLTLNSDRLTRTIIKIPTVCLYKRRKNEEIFNRCEPPTLANNPNSNETISLYLNDSNILTSSESGSQNTTELKTVISISSSHSEPGDLNSIESNSPHQIRSNILNSNSPSHGEPDSPSSRQLNGSNKRRSNLLNLTESVNTNQNGFEETGLHVTTIQSTNGSTCLIPSDLESLNTCLEGPRLQNDPVYDNKAVSNNLKLLESRCKKVSDLTIAQMITSL